MGNSGPKYAIYIGKGIYHMITEIGTSCVWCKNSIGTQVNKENIQTSKIAEKVIVLHMSVQIGMN